MSDAGPPVAFDDFIATAWRDHADHSREVADRLASSLAIVKSAEHVAPFARLATHVFGEHLGQWHSGIDLVQALQRLPAFDGTAGPTGAVVRGIATLRYASGDRSALDSLSLEDRVSVLATVASAFAGRQSLAEALSAYNDAVAIAGSGFPERSPAIRALAIGGNNLAATLEEKRDRSDAETVAMVEAAKSALKYWKLAGTWLEEARAEYRLTKSLLHSGDAASATTSARRCIDICSRNDAPACERFFAHSGLALALRKNGDSASFSLAQAAALAWFEEVPEDERSWCDAERRALDAVE